MHINEFDYELPIELIAQHPAEKRDHSRMMVIDRESGNVYHKHFYEILDYLKPTDCLVLNQSKVLPARLFGRKKETGAKIEFLLIKRKEGNIWETLVKPGKKLKIGDRVIFVDDPYFGAEIIGFGEEGTRVVRFEYEGVFMERLADLGKIPLPPYISRESTLEDTDRYQTVYCTQEGSVAAPTAGLHFTEEILEKAHNNGTKLAYVTLHVGIGTFRPVKCEIVEDHKMHFEEFEIDPENAKIINDTIRSGGRILSVGTTSTRTLESAAYWDKEAEKWLVQSGSGSTGIFIYPGYEFKIINALITNFHLPKSTLLMLVSALYNKKAILEAYKLAVDMKYRFFSYGDAMLII